jgi:hypothetical protein
VDMYATTLSGSVERDAVSGYDQNDESGPMAGANVNDASKGRVPSCRADAAPPAEVPQTGDEGSRPDTAGASRHVSRDPHAGAQNWARRGGWRRRLR